MCWPQPLQHVRTVEGHLIRCEKSTKHIAAAVALKRTCLRTYSVPGIYYHPVPQYKERFDSLLLILIVYKGPYNRITHHTGDKRTHTSAMNFRAGFLQNHGGTHTRNDSFGKIPSCLYYRRTLYVCRRLRSLPVVEKKDFENRPRGCVCHTIYG